MSVRRGGSRVHTTDTRTGGGDCGYLRRGTPYSYTGRSDSGGGGGDRGCVCTMDPQTFDRTGRSVSVTIVVVFGEPYDSQQDGVNDGNGFVT